MLNYPIFLFLIIYGFASICNTLKFPKEFVLCHRLDPNFRNCLARAVQNSIQNIASGNDELGVPDLNYLKVSNINIEKNGGAVDLTQHYTDCVITGTGAMIYTYAEAAFEKDNCYLRFKVNGNYTMDCDYVINGKIMLFQLNGNGHAKITLDNMTSWQNLTCSLYEKGGNEYLKIIDWVEEQNPDKIFYDIDNLMDGDVEMSAQLLQVVNDNALEVYKNVKSDYAKSFAAIYKLIANNVFDKLPWKNIFLD